MKQTILNKTFILLVVLLSVSTLSFAQYKGPGTKTKTYTVEEVIKEAYKLDRKDELVKVQGFIIKQINADTYMFRDKTGTIKVEIDKKRLPAKPFNDKTELILIGEVDYDLFQPVEIEVKEVLFK